MNYLRILGNQHGQKNARARLVGAVLLAGAIVGCSSGATDTTGAAGTSGTSGASSGVADEGDAAAGNGEVGGPLPSTLCASYIACVGTVSPPLLDGVIRAYGSGGSCFTAQTTEACSSNCRDGIVQLGAERATETTWKNAGCNACKETADCAHVGEVCSASACVQYAQATSASRDGMACDFGMSACGASDFCTSEHSGASGYGQGSCVSSSPQGQSCTPNAKSTPTGFECVDLSYSSYSQTYGPGGRYLARCSSGSDCPAGTTCLTGGAGGDPLSHCVGPRK